jgi:branched-chain amino acid aminotransferase
MINFNGSIVENDAYISVKNRGFNYGDAIFETLKVSHSKILFLEDHYFRLMASMRIMRMEIPMSFTMEFFKVEILKTLEANHFLKNSARVKIIVNRGEGGFYSPSSSLVDYIIFSEVIPNDFYGISEQVYIVDLFKDFYVAPGLLSTLKTNNKAINVIASVYAKENDFNNCLLLNTNKSVVEATNGNLFLVKGTLIKTPPLQDGCLKGVMRKQLIELIKSMPEYTIEEASISPFELQKADELFITNVIQGIQPITKYRKKEFKTDVTNALLNKMNIKVRLG